LKPGGRTALFEPIDDHRMSEFSEYWRRRVWADPDSEEAGPIRDLLERLATHWETHYKQVNSAMVNFNERDLVQMCVAAGFAGVRTELYMNVAPFPGMNWDALMRSSGNPLIPTNGEVISEMFSIEERERFEKHLRPIVERGGRPWRTQSSFTWAAKAPIPGGFWPY
jgi:hypothetical protein